MTERCLMATVLAREMRDVMGLVDPRRVPGVMGDDGFDLVLSRSGAGEIRSVFRPGERCRTSVERYYPSPGTIEVRFAEDPPPLLPAGRSYALLFVEDLEPGQRWRFAWSLRELGYRGCPKPEAGHDQKPIVYPCRHPEFMHGGPPTANVRVVVRKHGAWFEAEEAVIDLPTWTSTKPRSP